MLLRPVLPSLALLVAGCTAGAGAGAYPSLAKRPIESGQVAAPSPTPVAVAHPSTSDPALDADIARLTDQGRKGSAAFDQAYPDAERKIRAAAGSAVSSDGWVAAQVALSGLESARNDSVSALAGLDSLYADRVNAIADGKAQGGADAIDAARTEMLALVDAQNDRLDGLKAVLPQP